MNKEVIKLRNNYNDINVKNQIMLQRAESLAKSYGLCTDLSKNKYKAEIENELDLFMDFTNGDDDLNIQNDKNFKIISKPDTYKLTVESREYEMFKDSRTLSYFTPEDDKKAHVLPIARTHVDGSTYSATNDKEKQNDQDEKCHQNNLDTTVSELQEILIMMALSSKSNNIEGDSELTPSYHIDTQSEIIETRLEKLSLACNSINNEEFTTILNVTPMRIEISDCKKRMLRKYVEKWKRYVKSRKEFLSQQRQKTLNSFFDKIEKKKKQQKETLEPVNRSRDYSTYQHRYKVQKHIIALQKARLEEQYRLIEELKYNKIIEASRQSVDEMKEEVKKTYFEIDRQLKPKIKCLTNELKIPEIEESALVLQCLKVPQFLQRMEKRAREREEKHALIRERRKQMEEERIRLKQQAEVAKAEMDKEEKIKIMKELREKRKREKIENIRKKQYAERIRALTVMADLHYEKFLLMQYGMRPLKMLLKMKRDNLERTKAHYTFQLKKNVFLHLMWYTEDMWYERNYKAENFHRKKILKTAFECLKQHHYEYILKKQVAEDYYDLYVTQLIFRKLRAAIVLLRKEHEIKWQKVVTYYNSFCKWTPALSALRMTQNQKEDGAPLAIRIRAYVRVPLRTPFAFSNLLFKTFTCWRTLPALNALKREQEARKVRWREKVLQVVPDYMPPDD